MNVSLYALRHYYDPPFLLLSLWRVKNFRHGYIQIFKLSHVNFHPPDRVEVRENKDWVMHLFFKKFAKKKKNRPSCRKLKKNGTSKSEPCL